MDLRETIGRLTTFRCTWTAEEVAALAEVSLCGARKYLTALTRAQVLTLTGDQYSAGPQARAWRSQPRKAKGPSSYGNSAKYRATRALWDNLRQRDWQAGREGVVLTSQEPTQDQSGQHQPAGDNKMERTITYTALLTLDQVAAEIGHHVETVRREIKRGKIQAIRTGIRGVRIPRESLNEYLRANLIGADRGAQA